MENPRKVAQNRAYAPYSNFLVGAALETRDGKVYLSCNIENASCGASSCAERTAFFKAVSEGERHFAKIAIVGGERGGEVCHICAPCRVCRQVMSEFCGGKTFVILLEGENGEIKRFALDGSLPFAFEKVIHTVPGRYFVQGIFYLPLSCTTLDGPCSACVHQDKPGHGLNCKRKRCALFLRTPLSACPFVVC